MTDRMKLIDLLMAHDKELAGERDRARQVHDFLLREVGPLTMVDRDHLAGLELDGEEERWVSPTERAVSALLHRVVARHEQDRRINEEADTKGGT